MHLHSACGFINGVGRPLIGGGITDSASDIGLQVNSAPSTATCPLAFID